MAPRDEGESSSNSLPNSIPQWKYHVFLSFRGETRTNFTDFLYIALVRKGISTFRDKEQLERGEIIPEQLHKAIEKSLSTIIVLSPEYASSAWCLNELQVIVESKKLSEGLIFPVFYDVEPSDVRYQRGSFAEAFRKHEERYKEDKVKVERWREALRKVADLSGYPSKDRHQSELIEEIVGELWKKLQPKLPLHDDGLVGIHSRKKTILSLFGKDVCFIGIWGMGGIGKTTLARVVYETIRKEFEISCFLANVREISSERDGLVELQKNLLSCLKISSLEIEDSYDGKNKIRNQLSNTKVLLVLDDISNKSQLENLAGNQKWFGPGSKVIITTRDQQLLTIYDVFEIYPMPILNSEESLKLFCQKAFKDQLKPEERYMKLSREMVRYADGLPLALEVLGSFLCRRSISEWEDVLVEIKKFPPEDIMSRLQISYEALDDNKKNIFLNIACFFNGMNRSEVTHILEVCDLNPFIGINVLLERSLLTLHKNYDGKLCLMMHDLLIEMAIHIVYQESQKDIGKFSRLWLQNDINHVMEKDKGTKFIQGIVIRFHKHYKVHWNPNAFSKMHNVKLLKIGGFVELSLGLNCFPEGLNYLEWEKFPLPKLPLGVQLVEVVELRMHYSKIKILWHGPQPFRKLKFIDLTGSMYLIRFPNVSGAQLIEQLILDYCTSLIEIDESVGQLKKLKELKLRGCKNLKKLPSKLEMDSLKNFIVEGCSKLEKLPEFENYMKFLTELDLSGCRSLVCLPRSIYKLKSLTIIKHSKFIKIPRLPPVYQEGLDGGREWWSLCLPSPWIVRRYLISWLLSYIGLSTLPPELGCLYSLLRLDLSRSNIVELPCIANLINLYELNLNSCPRLKSVPKLPPNVDWFYAADCSSLETLSDLQNLCDFFTTHSHPKKKRFWFHGPCLFFPGTVIPPWFSNQNSFHASPFYSVHLSRRGLDIFKMGIRIPIDPLREYNPVPPAWASSKSAISINVDIPDYCLSSDQWWGIAVCLVVENPSPFRSHKFFKVRWICRTLKATLPNPSSDSYFIYQGDIYDSHLCIFLLRGDDTIIQRCLIKDDQNILQLSFEAENSSNINGIELKISKCGCRVICEQDFKAMCEGDQNNDNVFVMPSTSTSDLYKTRVREIADEWAMISNLEGSLGKEYQDLFYTEFERRGREGLLYTKFRRRVAEVKNKGKM